MLVSSSSGGDGGSLVLLPAKRRPTVIPACNHHSDCFVFHATSYGCRQLGRVRAIVYRFSLQYSTHVELEACLINPNIGVAYNSDNNSNSTTTNNSDDDNTTTIIIFFPLLICIQYTCTYIIHKHTVLSTSDLC